MGHGKSITMSSEMLSSWQLNSKGLHKANGSIHSPFFIFRA